MREPLAKNRERLRRLRRDNPEWNRAKNAKWKSANPQKHAAHRAVKRAVRKGLLTKQPCQRCGSVELVHAHHDDYTKEMDVMWLCPMHHRERHREIDAAAVQAEAA